MRSSYADEAYRTSIITTSDPYPFYHWLQEHDPVHYSAAEDLWVLTRHDDCVRALGEWPIWSSARRGNLINDMPDRIGRTLGTTDPPRHTATRRIVSSAFTPRTVSQLEGKARALATDYVNQAAERGAVEFVSDVLTPVIAALLGSMFGVPEDEFFLMRAWLGDFFLRDVPVAGADAAGAETRQAAAMRELRAYFAGLVAAKRRQPTTDLLSALLEAEVDGDHLGEEQVIVTTMTFLAAGSESTSNLVTNALVALSRHPPVLGRLSADPGLVAAALEETLRWDSPTQGFVRTPTQPITLHDKVIPMGAQVLVHIGAANRDPRVFAEPDRFDIDRDTRRHLSFGHGPHFCIGAALGRQIARVVCEELMTNGTSWRPHEASAQRITTPNHRGFLSLPVFFGDTESPSL